MRTPSHTARFTQSYLFYLFVGVGILSVVAMTLSLIQVQSRTRIASKWWQSFDADNTDKEEEILPTEQSIVTTKVTPKINIGFLDCLMDVVQQDTRGGYFDFFRGVSESRFRIVYDLVFKHKAVAILGSPEHDLFPILGTLVQNHHAKVESTTEVWLVGPEMDRLNDMLGKFLQLESMEPFTQPSWFPISLSTITGLHCVASTSELPKDIDMVWAGFINVGDEYPQRTEAHQPSIELLASIKAIDVPTLVINAKNAQLHHCFAKHLNKQGGMAVIEAGRWPRYETVIWSNINTPDTVPFDSVTLGPPRSSCAVALGLSPDVDQRQTIPLPGSMPSVMPDHPRNETVDLNIAKAKKCLIDPSKQGPVSPHDLAFVVTAGLDMTNLSMIAGLPQGARVVVYHPFDKADRVEGREYTLPPGRMVEERLKLPDIGQEATTMLIFPYDDYDDLPNLTCFVHHHGPIAWHAPYNFFEFFQSWDYKCLADLDVESGGWFMPIRIRDEGYPWLTSPDFQCDGWNWARDEWIQLMGTDVPMPAWNHYYCCTQFCVSKHRIKQHTKEWYANHVTVNLEFAKRQGNWISGLAHEFFWNIIYGEAHNQGDLPSWYP